MLNVRWAAIGAWLLVSAATLSAETIVIWDFAARDGEKTEITRSLTAEFEEAFVRRGMYVVVERRALDRLEAVIKNERALSDIGQISPSATAELKKIGAEGVIFGDVYDDVASGEVTVTVTLQDFQGRKEWIKSVSIRRGLLADAKSRREAMIKLSEDVSGIGDTGGAAGGKVVRTQKNDFIFDVEECALSDRTVLCRLQVTNNGEDRRLFVVLEAKHGGWADDKTFVEKEAATQLYDDFNNAASPSRIQLSNAKAEAEKSVAVGAMLIAGRPAEATLQFDGLSSKATMISRLDIACIDGETKSKFVATFRNIRLRR